MKMLLLLAFKNLKPRRPLVHNIRFFFSVTLTIAYAATFQHFKNLEHTAVLKKNVF